MVIPPAFRVPEEGHVRVRKFDGHVFPSDVVPDDNLRALLQVRPEPLHVLALGVLPPRDAHAGVARFFAQFLLKLRIHAGFPVRAQAVRHLMDGGAAVDADGKALPHGPGHHLAHPADREEFPRRGFVVRLLRVVEARGDGQAADDLSGFEDVEFLPGLVDQQGVLLRGRDGFEEALFHIAADARVVERHHRAVAGLGAVVGIGFDEHIAVPVRILFQDVHALALPVQLPRRVRLPGFLVDAGGYGGIHMILLIHVQHDDRLHHNIPDRLLVLRT